MISKKFLKTKPVVEVTFQVPEQLVEQTDATKVCLVGDFNEWDESANPMRKFKGQWKTTLKLEQGREYQYRFLINGSEWHNDWNADKYVPNEHGSDNSVVITFNN